MWICAGQWLRARACVGYVRGGGAGRVAGVGGLLTLNREMPGHVVDLALRAKVPKVWSLANGYFSIFCGRSMVVDIVEGRKGRCEIEQVGSNSGAENLYIYRIQSIFCAGCLALVPTRSLSL